MEALEGVKPRSMANTRFNPRRPMRDEVLRVAGELLDDVAKLLSGPPPHDERSIHAARTRLKRLRALARLARPSIGERAFAQANGVFRGVAQALGGLRDAKVRLDALASVRGKTAGDAEVEAFESELRRLYAEEVAARSVAAANPLPELLALLETERARIAAWKVAGDFDPFAEALARAWKSARRSWKRADLDAPEELMHDWRKRAKDTMYHLEFLAAAWPRPFAALGAELDALTDLIGDDHDLFVLEAALGPDRDARALRKAIARKRRRVRTKALRLGAKLYAEDEKAFAKRIRKAWEAESEG